mmetsp:Transcript_39769/g.71393  ORF Transcript_39769/g.71393 Transcript_39769/m.71393 type:complete len:241 (+) Transcript_39769:491-1213(+)
MNDGSGWCSGKKVLAGGEGSGLLGFVTLFKGHRQGLSLHHGGHSLGEALHVLAVDAGHGDAAVAGHVDGVLRRELVHILGVHSGEAEHADLVGDVVPGTRGARGLQRLAQALAHGDDAVRHRLHLAVPLLLQRRVAQDLSDNSRAVERGVGVGGACDGLQLALHRARLSGVLADNGEAADALAIQSHILRVGLTQRDLVSILKEDLDGLPILHAVSAGKALVRHVEECKVVLLQHQLAHF